MGAFNTVDVLRLDPCPRCCDIGLITVQFAYGDTQQYRYSVGDFIRWGGNDIGEQLPEVRILGTPEDCRVCGLGVEDEYILTIRDGRITGYERAPARDIRELQ